ncbi:MAG: hypothetical protein ABR610_07995 [Thermoanaerobaculia bacterium]
MFPRILLGILIGGGLVTASLAEGPRPSPAEMPVLEFAAFSPDSSSSRSSRRGESNRLEAGSLVEVRWSGLSPSANEVELLLSVDGGRTYSVRLTDELESEAGSWVWKVPRLDTNLARLAIRMGGDGREVIAAASRPFQIVPDPSAARIRLRWHSGEIWAEAEGGARTDRPLSDGDLSASPESMTVLPEAPDAAEIPRRMAGHPIAVRETHREFLVPRTFLVLFSRPPRSSPLAIPQRI